MNNLSHAGGPPLPTWRANFPGPLRGEFRATKSGSHGAADNSIVSQNYRFRSTNQGNILIGDACKQPAVRLPIIPGGFYGRY